MKPEPIQDPSVGRAPDFALVPLYAIAPAYDNPRKTCETAAMVELEASVKTHGASGLVPWAKPGSC